MLGIPAKERAGEIPVPSHVFAIGNKPPLLKSGLPTLNDAADWEESLGAVRIFVRNKIVLSNRKSADQTNEEDGAHVKLKYPSFTPTSDGVNSVALFHEVSLNVVEYHDVGVLVTEVLQSHNGFFDLTQSSLSGARLVTNTLQDLFVAVMICPELVSRI